MKSNPYTVLGIDPSASEQEIRHAYRKLAKKFHPDSLSGFGDAERFREVQEAFEYISSHPRGPSPVDPADFVTPSEASPENTEVKVPVSSRTALLLRRVWVRRPWQRYRIEIQTPDAAGLAKGFLALIIGVALTAGMVARGCQSSSQSDRIEQMIHKQIAKDLKGLKAP